MVMSGGSLLRLDQGMVDCHVTVRYGNLPCLTTNNGVQADAG